jgi:hypothetical protein
MGNLISGDAHIPNQLFEDLHEGKITHVMFMVMLWHYRYSTEVPTSTVIRQHMWPGRRTKGTPSIETLQQAIERLQALGYLKGAR